MNRKTISVLFLLVLTIIIGIPESFAYPQYGSSCSKCHATNIAQKGMGSEIGNNNATAQGRWSITSIADGNKNADPAQENTQTGDIYKQKMSPMRYTLGIIGTAFVAISQAYSIRKRGRKS